MDPNGSNRIRLSSLEAKNDTDPAWSPERCRIAFTSFTKEGDNDIYIMTADGKSVRQLTTDPARDMFPDWSPDGKQIVFVSYRNAGIRNLFLMDVDGSHQRQLTTNPAEYSQWEQWSPTGDEIAFTYNNIQSEPNQRYIFGIHPDGSGQHQITPNAGHLGELDSAWSPDGKKLFIISNRSTQTEIWVINQDGSGLKQITNFSHSNLVSIEHSLRVSPDGKQLAFYGVDSEVGKYASEMYLVNVDGSGFKNISHTSGAEEWLDW
jgi:Tol biopolymer transport system component